MSAPSVIALPGGQVLSPNWLHQRLRSIYGANLIGLYIGEDLNVLGADVIGWPGRVGGTLLPQIGPYRLTMLRNRPALGPPTVPAVDQIMALSSAALPKGCTVVVDSSTSLSAYEMWSSCYPSAPQTLIRNNLTAAFLGYNTYVDGVATLAIPTSGIHTYEGYNGAIAAGFGISGCRAFSVERVSRSAIGSVILTDALPSAAQRAATQHVLRTYYRY